MMSKPQDQVKGGSKKNKALLAGFVATVSVLSMGCLDGALGLLLSMLLAFVGATPAPDFPSSGRVDFNLIAQEQVDDKEDPGDGNLGGDEDQPGVTPDNVEYIIEVDDPANTTAKLISVDVKDVQEVGTFTILFDSSGSMEGTFTGGICDTCPHDPERRRVDAAQIISKEVLNRTPESRIALYDWGVAETDQYLGIRELTGYTSDSSKLVQGAEQTGSLGATFIYDSLMDILDLMSSDIQANFATRPVTKGIIILTDGQDTHSISSISEVIEKSKALEIPIHVVGLGEAGEKFNELFQGEDSNADIVADMRRLASETGGFYASVDSAEDLQRLAEFIALGLVGGFTTTTVELDPIPASGTIVRGTIYVKDPESGDPVKPGEPWEFVAP